MEAADLNLNHLETAPATAFPVYQIEEQRLPVLQNDMYNHYGTMHYAGAGHGHSPILYGQLPVFPPTVGYISGTYQAYPYAATLNGTNVMCDGPQFNCIQQPLFHSQVSGKLNFVPSSLYSPEPFDASFLPSGGIVHGRGISSSNDRDVYTQLKISYGSPDDVNFSRFHHNMVAGQNLPSEFSTPGYHLGGWPWMNVYGGLTHGICPRATSSSLNYFPMPQGHLQHYFPMPNDRIRSAHGDRSARYLNGDPHRCFHGPFAASRPFRTRIPNEQNSFGSQHGSKDTARTSLNHYSIVSPTVRAINSTIGNIRSGRAQWSQLTQFSKDPAPDVKRRGIQTTLAPHQFWRRKIKTQPSISPSKPFSKRNVPTYHVRWNDMPQGCDEQCQPVGENCHLCNRDLAYLPTDYDSERDYEPEFSNLPNVSVLPCGHTFHSECVQLITPENQSRDPPCEICANDKF